MTSTVAGTAGVLVAHARNRDTAIAARLAVLANTAAIRRRRRRWRWHSRTAAGEHESREREAEDQKAHPSMVPAVVCAFQLDS